MKRIALFLLTNIAVLLMLAVIVRALGLDAYLTQQGLNLQLQLAFSTVVGFSGSIVSLLLSRPMARWTTGARVIDAGRASSSEQWLLNKTSSLAREAGIEMPQVAVYEGPPNAFATGATRNRSMVAVSTGLLNAMSPEQLEAVLSHEITHVANGDMVTLALLQGVLNTFIIFVSRVVGFIVDRRLAGSRRNRAGSGPGFYMTVFACQVLFGLLASLVVMAYSRHREYRADRGSADLLGTPLPMISALERLQVAEAAALPASLRAMGVADKSAWLALMSSHPSIEDRISALRAVRAPARVRARA